MSIFILHSRFGYKGLQFSFGHIIALLKCLSVCSVNTYMNLVKVQAIIVGN